MAEGNPMSFLHVVKPEIDLDPEIDLYDDRVYAKAAENFARAAKAAGVEITGFVRLEVGEGIEVEKEDFAAEVKRAKDENKQQAPGNLERKRALARKAELEKLLDRLRLRSPIDGVVVPMHARDRSPTGVPTARPSITPAFHSPS